MELFSPRKRIAREARCLAAAGRRWGAVAPTRRDGASIPEIPGNGAQAAVLPYCSPLRIPLNSPANASTLKKESSVVSAGSRSVQSFFYCTAPAQAGPPTLFDNAAATTNPKAGFPLPEDEALWNQMPAHNSCKIKCVGETHVVKFVNIDQV